MYEVLVFRKSLFKEIRHILMKHEDAFFAIM